ncbi:MAG: c-type cytochrome [Gammaproteobacteria bacterium]|nr:c-type cytochrome [Gammaproteobacteria bacterium]MCF6231458.1 c-type cytochrome [Gammaproteobacteria bacterium]
MYFVLLVVLLGTLLGGCSRDAGDVMTTHNLEDRALGKVKSILIRGGCFGCHDVNEHRFGPAWSAVSARYKDDPEAAQKLFESIKYGSGGKWTAVAASAVMPPNEHKANDTEIAAVVEYILSL